MLPGTNIRYSYLPINRFEDVFKVIGKQDVTGHTATDSHFFFKILQQTQGRDTFLYLSKEGRKIDNPSKATLKTLKCWQKVLRWITRGRFYSGTVFSNAAKLHITTLYHDWASRPVSSSDDHTGQQNHENHNASRCATLKVRDDSIKI